MKFLSGKYFFPAVICAGFFLVFSLWVVYEFIKDYSQQISCRHKYSSNLANVVSEAVTCELRSNKGDIKGLETLFKRYINSGPIEHIRIETDGRILSQINPDKSYFVDFGSDDFFRRHDTILIRKKIYMLPNDKQQAWLIIAFNSEGCFADADSKSNFLTLFFLSGCFGISVSFLFLSYAIRNRELKNRLMVERNKSEHVDELGLAAAGLAHETKNPLGVIRGLAQNIADDSENAKKTRHMARDIMEETDVTTARLGNFLSYAKFRQPNPVEIKTQEYLNRMVGLVKDDFDNAGVELEVIVESPLIYADQDMLSQILLNLLTNSLRFTDKGGKVSLSLREKLNKTAELKVEDNGAGIPADILPNIFKPYVTSSSKGYGIGLAIVKRIVDQAEWNIKVDSVLKEGTVITISNIKRVILRKGDEQ